jgi:hypothetical protein
MHINSISRFISMKLFSYKIFVSDQNCKVIKIFATVLKMVIVIIII